MEVLIIKIAERTTSVTFFKKSNWLPSDCMLDSHQ